MYDCFFIETGKIEKIAKEKFRGAVFREMGDVVGKGEGGGRGGLRNSEKRHWIS